jgi:elongation factor P--(R)-beta-lysine ligase
LNAEPSFVPLAQGRVFAVDFGDTGATIVLGDAFAATAYEAPRDVAATLSPGDLVIVQISAGTPPRIVACTERQRPMRTDGDPDWVRFSLGGIGPGLRRRALAARTVRTVFAGLDFLEVETPAVVPSPGLDPHLAAVEADGAFLITSPEYQMKRLVSGGIFRCFQLARCHRRDESGALHNPEFTMVEWYRAFADVDAVMDDTEQLVVAVAAALGNASRFDLPAETGVGRRLVDLARPFPRLTVREAFERFAETDETTMLELATHDEERFFELLVTLVEPALAKLPTPIFLCEFPASQASLARRKPSDARYAERFELYAAGVELCNGFGELVDAVEQRARLLADQHTRAERGLPIYPIDERFLASLEHGLPRCAGNALGFDRLVALASGHPDIRRIQAFPRERL